jgi:hypothetical protein
MGTAYCAFEFEEHAVSCCSVSEKVCGARVCRGSGEASFSNECDGSGGGALAKSPVTHWTDPLTQITDAGGHNEANRLCPVKATFTQAVAECAAQLDEYGDPMELCEYTNKDSGIATCCGRG